MNFMIIVIGKRQGQKFEYLQNGDGWRFESYIPVKLAELAAEISSRNMETIAIRYLRYWFGDSSVTER